MKRSIILTGLIGLLLAGQSVQAANKMSSVRVGFLQKEYNAKDTTQERKAQILDKLKNGGYPAVAAQLQKSIPAKSAPIKEKPVEEQIKEIKKEQQELPVVKQEVNKELADAEKAEKALAEKQAKEREEEAKKLATLEDQKQTLEQQQGKEEEAAKKNEELTIAKQKQLEDEQRRDEEARNAEAERQRLEEEKKALDKEQQRLDKERAEALAKEKSEKELVDILTAGNAKLKEFQAQLDAAQTFDEYEKVIEGINKFWNQTIVKKPGFAANENSREIKDLQKEVRKVQQAAQKKVEESQAIRDAWLEKVTEIKRLFGKATTVQDYENIKVSITKLLEQIQGMPGFNEKQNQSLNTIVNEDFKKLSTKAEAEIAKLNKEKAAGKGKEEEKKRLEAAAAKEKSEKELVDTIIKAGNKKLWEFQGQLSKAKTFEEYENVIAGIDNFWTNQIEKMPGFNKTNNLIKMLKQNSLNMQHEAEVKRDEIKKAAGKEEVKEVKGIPPAPKEVKPGKPITPEALEAQKEKIKEKAAQQKVKTLMKKHLGAEEQIKDLNENIRTLNAQLEKGRKERLESYGAKGPDGINYDNHDEMLRNQKVQLSDFGGNEQANRESYYFYMALHETLQKLRKSNPKGLFESYDQEQFEFQK